MSHHQNSHDEDIPRFEPWLGVMAASVVPVVVALYVHSRLLMPLFDDASFQMEGAEP